MTAFPLPFKKGERVALIGMGVSNRGVLQLLCSRPDLRITLRDRHGIALPDPLPFRVPPRVIIGEGYLRELSEDALFLAPTVRLYSPEIAAARERGALVSSDTAFFFENTVSHIFAVTGSDGKSTTCSLAAQILRLSAPRVRLGGNIGTPLTPMLPNEKTGDLTVAELSSFQLMQTHKTPKRALLTNLTPNHLDFHSSLEEYYNVKLALLFSSNEPILNLDDTVIRTRFSDSMAFVGYTACESTPSPIRAEHIYSLKESTVYLDGVPYLSLAPILHRGRVFAKNLLAALALTHGFHEKDSLTEAISDLHTLPHRRELVRDVDGVRYYDSSVDSSPSRTRETLGDFPQGTVVILGGRSKGVPYDILTDALNEKARAVVLTGENAPTIRDELVGLRAPLFECESLFDAVSLCASLAEPGDCVLFSPASTSFDRYRNFEERGECFARLVQSL